MASVISRRTIIVSIALALIGIVFNTTRFSLAGTEFNIWVVVSILSAFLLVHGVQYGRLAYVQ